jgi:peptide/nickel transport system permease protein
MSVAQLAVGRGRPPILTRLGGIGWLSVLSATIAIILILVAVLAPVIAPHDPEAIDPLNVFVSASAAHPLGTDDTGRDLLSRLLYGARPSLAGPAIVVLLSSCIGTLLALLAGMLGGAVDAVLSRVLDILFAFPGLILAVVAAAVFGAGFLAPVLALSLAYIPVIARILRSAVQREAALPYVSALRVQGASQTRIALRHVLPNLAPLVLVQSAVGFGYAMLDLASISFLGLGIQPPTPDWGVMAANGQPSILDGNPQQSLYAALVVVLAVVSFNLVGERLAQHFEIEEAR